MARWLLEEFDDPQAVLEEIVRLRRRGLGARRIAKLIFGNRIGLEAGTKRIQRLLAKLSAGPTESLDIFGHLPDQFPMRSDQFTSIEPKLGPTERLVYDALNVLEEASAAMIHSYIQEQGIRKTLWAIRGALKRLYWRGLVYRTRRGYYSLVTGLYYHDLLAENVHVSELPIPLYSKKERGRAAMLSGIIQAAEQLRATSTERIELWMPVADRRLREWALRLRRLGWRLTKIYFNTEENVLKVEAVYYNAVYPLRTAYRSHWLQLYAETLMLSAQSIQSILRRLGVQGAGWRGVSKSVVGGVVV